MMDKIDILLTVILVILVGILLIPKWFCITEYIDKPNISGTGDYRVIVSDKKECYNIIEMLIKKKELNKKMLERLTHNTDLGVSSFSNESSSMMPSFPLSNLSSMSSNLSNMS